MEYIIEYMKFAEKQGNRKILLEIKSNGSGKIYNVKTNNILISFENIYELIGKCKYLLDIEETFV